MVVALSVDYKELSTTPEAVENAELIKESADALVVNVHANYVLDEAQRYADMAFPHMLQMHAQFEAAERFGSTRPVGFEENSEFQPRPFRRPDYADEWPLLKKAWSLHSRGRDKLADKEMSEATARFYFDEPLDNLPDWVWRFSTFLGATKYEQILRSMMEQVRQPLKAGAFADLLAEHAKDSAARSQRFFGVFRDYFSAWSEFSQVHFRGGEGRVGDGRDVSTTSGFNAVRMFYGNVFEAFASSVDLLAFMNNVLDGRVWQQFRNIDADTYLKSDKPKRFDAFLERPGFGALPEERDAQLRNASHHAVCTTTANAGRSRTARARATPAMSSSCPTRSTCRGVRRCSSRSSRCCASSFLSARRRARHTPSERRLPRQVSPFRRPRGPGSNDPTRTPRPIQVAKLKAQ